MFYTHNTGPFKKRPPRELRGEQACRGNMLTPGVCWRHLEGAKAAGRQRWREGTRGAVLRGLGAGRMNRENTEDLFIFQVIFFSFSF